MSENNIYPVLSLTSCRLAHRLRDIQTLPYVVVTNPHISNVYELYYKAFETLRRVQEIKTVEDNDRYCAIISGTLKEHLTVIPSLAMGVLECQELMEPEAMDKFMNTLLRSVWLPNWGQTTRLKFNSESLVESLLSSIWP